MNKQYTILVLMIFSSVAFACKGPAAESTLAIEINDAAELLSNDKSVVVLDVRTPAEYAAGHIENAINIDINTEDFSQRVALLDRDRTYIVHCALNVPNGRAANSLSVMKEMEFKNLLDLQGGIAAWQENSLPLVN